jgi:hypothetical protein
MSTPITGVVTNCVIIPDSPLPESAKIAVFVLLQEKPSFRRISMLELVKSLPPGPRLSNLGGV